MPFVRRSHGIWRGLEAEAGALPFEACGLAMMAPPAVRTGHYGKADFLNRTIEAVRRHGVPHEALETGNLQARALRSAVHRSDPECRIRPRPFPAREAIAHRRPIPWAPKSLL